MKDFFVCSVFVAVSLLLSFGFLLLLHIPLYDLYTIYWSVRDTAQSAKSNEIKIIKKIMKKHKMRTDCNTARCTHMHHEYIITNHFIITFLFFCCGHGSIVIMLINMHILLFTLNNHFRKLWREAAVKKQNIL